MKQEQKYPKGHWQVLGLSIGLTAGLAGGLLYRLLQQNQSLSLTIGAVAGAIAGWLLGRHLEWINRHNIRELTPQENARRKNTLTLTLMSVIMLIVVSLLLYLKQRANTGN